MKTYLVWEGTVRRLDKPTLSIRTFAEAVHSTRRKTDLVCMISQRFVSLLLPQNPEVETLNFG